MRIGPRVVEVDDGLQPFSRRLRQRRLSTAPMTNKRQQRHPLTTSDYQKQRAGIVTRGKEIRPFRTEAKCNAVVNGTLRSCNKIVHGELS